MGAGRRVSSDAELNEGDLRRLQRHVNEKRTKSDTYITGRLCAISAWSRRRMPSIHLTSPPIPQTAHSRCASANEISIVSN